MSSIGRDDSNLSVMHNLTLINYAISIIPITIYVIVYTIFFSLSHSVEYKVYFIPSISDILIFNPEYQIFSITMSIEYLTIIFVFYVQDKIRTILFNRSYKLDKQKFQIMRIISYISFLLYIFGGIFLSLIPFKTSPTFNSICANFNGYGGIALFLCCDIFNAYLSCPSLMVSRIMTWVNVVTTFLNICIRYYLFTKDNSNQQTWWTISTVFQIISQFTGFLKFTLLARNLPKSAVRMSRKLI